MSGLDGVLVPKPFPIHKNTTHMYFLELILKLILKFLYKEV